MLIVFRSYRLSEHTLMIIIDTFSTVISEQMVRLDRELHVQLTEEICRAQFTEQCVCHDIDNRCNTMVETVILAGVYNQGMTVLFLIIFIGKLYVLPLKFNS